MDHNCFSLTELQELLDVRDEATLATDCPRCRALLGLLRGHRSAPALEVGFGDAAEPAGLAPQIPGRGNEGPLRPGALVSITDDRCGSGTLLLAAVILVRDSSLEVAPITASTDQAAEWDLLLSDGDSDLGYAVAVEVWNHGTIDAEQVGERLGSVADGQKDALLRLWDAVFVDEQPPPEVSVGPALLSGDDPRVVFQAAEVERVQRFRRLDEPDAAPEEPVSRPAPQQRAPAGSESRKTTVADIAHIWMEREGWELADLARESGYLKHQLEPIFESRIDPCAPEYDEKHLSRFLDVVSFDDDNDDAGEVLFASIDATVFPDTPEDKETLVFNRHAPRRRRRRSRDDDQSQDVELTPVQLEQAWGYVRGVLSALEELRDS